MVGAGDGYALGSAEEKLESLKRKIGFERDRVFVKESSPEKIGALVKISDSHRAVLKIDQDGGVISGARRSPHLILRRGLSGTSQSFS